jgi:hypothetical protein
MRAIGAAILCLLLMRMDAAAHRLDEYLQATRVSLARGAVTLEVDLTPGASIAASVLDVLDTDRDGRFSALEAGAYGRAVVEDLVIELYFRNNHRPGGSVYLVNALVSEDPTVRVERQRRDVRQQEARIDYTVGSKWPGPALWLFAGGAVLSTILVRRRQQTGRQG